MTVLGITNGECEQFINGNKLVTICSGQIYYDLDMPDMIRNLRLEELSNDMNAQASLKHMGISDIDERLLQFCKCRFGGYDDKPDTVLHIENNPDYWNCGKRGICKEEFSLCRPIIAFNGQMTRTEIEIIKLIAQDLADKQIAYILEVSENTIHTHRYNITKKIGCSSKNGIVAFAYENGILNNK